VHNEDYPNPTPPNTQGSPGVSSETEREETDRSPGGEGVCDWKLVDETNESVVIIKSSEAQD